jgi:hypothetical protein
MLDAVKGFRRLKAKRQLPQLRAALLAHRKKADPASSVAQAGKAAWRPYRDRRSRNIQRHIPSFTAAARAGYSLRRLLPVAWPLHAACAAYGR